MKPFHMNSCARADDMKFRRSKSETIQQSATNRVLTVLHTRRDLRKNDVAVFKIRIPLLDLAEWAQKLLRDRAALRVDCWHRNKRRRRFVQTRKLPTSRRVQLTCLTKTNAGPL